MNTQHDGTATTPIQMIKLSEELLKGLDIDSRWYDGPFHYLKKLPPKAKGTRFELIAHAILKYNNCDVQPALSTNHDRIIDGFKCEIKGSTITKDTSDCFSFLQIRPDQDYHFLILETFWFDGTIKFFRINKNDLLLMIDKKIFSKQHGGNKAQSGTFCYNGNMTPFEKYYWFEVKIG